jgi:predicted house-cleaning noncanonical NTP pyrophosphatase (MazG superfamily)
MSKLIRDGSKQFLESKHTEIVYEQAGPADRRLLLFSKLLEEAGEWLNARDKEQALKELGDLTEIIWALGEIDDIPAIEITSQAASKQRLRGGFDELWVMKVDVSEKKPEHVCPRPAQTRTYDTSYSSVGYSG